MALLLFAAPAAAQASLPYWPMMKLMRRLDGARIHVGTQAVRVDKDTTLCAGRGPSIKRDGVRRWRRFICTYTTFTKQGVDRDLDFQVRVLGSRHFAVSDAHWVGGSR